MLRWAVAVLLLGGGCIDRDLTASDFACPLVSCDAQAGIDRPDGGQVFDSGVGDLGFADAAGRSDAALSDSGADPDAGAMEAGIPDAMDVCDLDGDGFMNVACGGDDCDDRNRAVFPFAQEGPTGDPSCSNGADDDCDGDPDGDSFACQGRNFRSIGSPLSSSSNPFRVIGFFAEFQVAPPDDLGVGDLLAYDVDGVPGLDELAVVHRRFGPKLFGVRAPDGGLPAPVSQGSAVLYRSYPTLEAAFRGEENLLIPDHLRDFDAWTASAGPDLTARRQAWNLACYAGAGSTSGAVLENWSTGASYYLRIFSPDQPEEVGATQRFDSGGLLSNNCGLTVAGGEGLRLLGADVRVEGLRLAGSVSGALLRIDTASTAAEVEVRNVVLDCGPSSAGEGLSIGGALVARVANAQVLGCADAGGIGIAIRDTSVSFVYNNTSVGNDVGLHVAGGTVVAKNNLAVANNENYQVGPGGVFEPNTSSNNGSGSADAPGLNPVNQVPSSVFADVNLGDLHLTATATAVLGQGIDLSSDGIFPITDDIDGQPRPAGPWDLGADER